MFYSAFIPSQSTLNKYRNHCKDIAIISAEISPDKTWKTSLLRPLNLRIKPYLKKSLKTKVLLLSVNCK